MSELVDLLAAPTAIVGTTGAGKSYAAKGAVEELLRRKARVVIIDPTGAWYGLRSGADGDEAGGFPVLILGGDHGDIEITEHSGAAIAEAMAGREVQAIIDTSEMTGGEKTRFMTDFLQTLYARNKAVLYLVVDEADEIAPQNPMPEERRLSGAFDKIVRRGRIKGFRPLMITQRPAVLHKNVLSQIGTLVALKLTSPQDRKAIDDWVKGNADTDKGRSVMQSLPGLARGEGWIWSPAASVLERVTFPPITTFDSSRTPQDGETIVAPAMTAVDVDELRAAVTTPVAAPAKVTAASKADLEAAEHRGFDRGLAEGRLAGYAEAAKELGGRVLQMISDLVLQFQEAAPVPAPAAASGPPALAPAVVPLAKRPTPTVADGDGPLSPSALKVVNAVLSAYPIGLSLATAAKRAGLSPRSSAFGRYLRDAAADPRIRDRGDGRYVALQGQPGMPAPTGLSEFKARLSPSYAAILGALESDSGWLSADTIAVAAQVSRTSSGLTAGLRELVALGLAERRDNTWRLHPDFGALL